MDIFFHGETVQLNGDPIEVGKMLPNFQLKNNEGNIIKKDDIIGKIMLISVVPDLNTRVCSLSTRKFNQEADQYTEAKFITVSTNAPKDQQNWCALEGVKSVQVFSDEDKSFGKSMNLYIPINDCDTRAIYIIDQNGKVIYREIIRDISNEPNYNKALEIIQNNKN